MGGDHGLSVTIPAAVSFLSASPGRRALLVGREPELSAALESLGPSAEVRSRLEIIATDEVVLMDDPPAVALRSKRRSSMRLAIEAVKEGRAHAAVSAGNTGALMAIARYVLKTMEGIDRPAIATAMPNQKGGVTTMLDLGANVDCNADHLLQFASMGAALVSVIHDKQNPTVGLLNIGEEVIKGNDTVKLAGELLRASHLNFYGNVEGDDIFKGTTDVVVCDGFVGNVALKTAEGLAQMLRSFIKQEFTRSGISKLLGVIAMPVLKRFSQRVDHRRYNGAALLGLRGIVFKSHGSADALAFGYALGRAADAAAYGLNEKIAQAIALDRPETIPHPDLKSQSTEASEDLA
ncbi:MAG: phosphate acyltransferase PlsX [Betaproteobacteria bacterium]|nr:phosphate acyltransferase PlsX [Betaproteobacteria bacterium]